MATEPDRETKDTIDNLKKSAKALESIKKLLESLEKKSEKADKRDTKEERGLRIADKQERGRERISWKERKAEFNRNHLSFRDMNASMKKTLRWEQRKTGAGKLVNPRGKAYMGASSKSSMGGLQMNTFKKLGTQMKGFKDMVKPKTEEGGTESKTADGFKSALKFAAGGSIVAMLGKKLFDSSPLLQAMMKLFNTSIMLIFRPIGDFIGGFIRPIMLFFMKNIVIPFYKKYKDMGAIGEKMGKAALGFLLKPGEMINKWLVLWAHNVGLSAFLGAETVAKAMAYDPIKDWQEQNDIDPSATTAGISGRDTGISIGSTQSPVEAETELREKAVSVVQEGLTFDQLRNMHLEEGTRLAEMAAEDGKLTEKEFQSLYQHAQNAEHAGLNSALSFDHMAEVLKKASDRLSKMFRSRIQTEYRKLEPNKSLIKDLSQKKSFLDNSFITSASGSSVADEIKYSAAQRANSNAITKAVNSSTYQNGVTRIMTAYKNKPGKIWSEMQKLQHRTGVTGVGAEGAAILAKVEAAKASGTHGFNKLDEYRNAMGSAMATGSSSGKQTAMDLIAMQSGMYGKTAKDILGYANGGIINEPIFGIGASGKRYSFGERGAETVVPGTSGGVSHVLNVNIGNVAREADYTKLKPIIQRWILEANSRRGVV